MRWSRPTFGLWLAIVVACLTATSTDAAVPAVLVDRGLKSEQVTLLGLNDQRVVFFDGQRVRRSEAVSNFVRIRSIGNLRGRTSPKGDRLVLTDGQRFTGSFEGSTSDGQAITWRHPLLGKTTVPLTKIARLHQGTEKQAQPAFTGVSQVPAKDIVTLANGDTLRGFIEALADQQLSIIPEGGDQAIQLPLGRVQSMRLANPRQSPEAEANAQRSVMLSDGSRILAGSVRFDGKAVGLTKTRLEWTRPSSEEDHASGQPMTLPVQKVIRIDLGGSGLILDDLASMDWRITGGGKVFGVTTPPRMDGADLLLHAPITLTVNLSEDAQRLAATVMLDPPKDVPQDRLAWAGCTLKVHHGTDRPARFSLSAEQRTARINVPIQNATLRLELAPATNGPILDRIRLQSPIILRQVK